MNNCSTMLKTNPVSSREITLCFTFLLYHVSGMNHFISAIHSPNILTVIPSDKLNTVDILQSLEKYKCQMLTGLPKILYNLINHPDRIKYDLSSLLLASSGGQSISSDLIVKLKNELNIKLFIPGYGSTETLSGIFKIYFLDFFKPELYRYCLGKQFAFTETKIVDPITKSIQSHNVEGELYFRSRFLTKGYWNDEEKTKEAIDENGW